MRKNIECDANCEVRSVIRFVNSKMPALLKIMLKSKQLKVIIWMNHQYGVGAEIPRREERRFMMCIERPYAATKTQQTMNKLHSEIFHLLYSPDIPPSDFHLFANLRAFLDGQIFRAMRDLKKLFSLI
ncbi:hypothetical protein AVEN_170985-1 [Araneus ventricosus]|uniref:Uncharacterized protein n=1 Tax=Araneus ventricosus TaxID=182803 RepID=A0A4Y2GGA7_ARAVE|nr:hypothetical protein AVEN_170985-1 [Araneus ventricosus]